MNEQLKNKTGVWYPADYETKGIMVGEKHRVLYAGQISPCGQFGIRVAAKCKGDEWQITHLNTGLKFPRFEPDGMASLTEIQTKAFIERIAALLDWNALTLDSPDRPAIAPRIRTIFNELFLTTTNNQK